MAPPYNPLTQFPSGGSRQAISGWLDDWTAEPIVAPIDPWYRPGDLTFVQPGAKLISYVDVPVHAPGAQAWGGTWEFDENTGIILQVQRSMWQKGVRANTFKVAEWDPSAFNMSPETMSVELGNVCPLALVALLNGAFNGIPQDKNGNTFDNSDAMICTDQIYGGALAVLPSTSITAWVTSTAYIKGQKVTSNGNIYKAGSTATSGATAPTGTTTASDGTITWTYIYAATMQAQKLVNPANAGFLSGQTWFNSQENLDISADNIVASIVNQQTRPAMNGIELGIGDEGLEIWVPFTKKERARQLVEVFRQLPGVGPSGAAAQQVAITGGGSQVIFSQQDNPVYGRLKVRAISGLRSDMWCVVSPRPRPRPQYSLFLHAQGGAQGQWGIQTEGSAMRADKVPHIWVKQWTEDSAMYAGAMKGTTSGDIGITMLLNEGFAFGSGILIDVNFTGYAS
jgi:hypothetical protein